MKFFRTPAALALSCVVASSFSAACTVRLDSQSQIVREEKRFTVKGRPVVRATTFDGSIQIQSWDKSEVLVEIEKRGATREAVDALVVKATQKEDAIDVEVQKQADVRARSGDGSITMDRVTGRIDLHTGDGSIRANDICGDMTISTGDG